MSVKRFSALLLIAAASICSLPAVAQAQPASAQSEVVREDALELARLLNPPEPLIKLAGRSFDEAFDKGMASEGGSEALEKAYPGIIAALRQTIRDLTLADLKADMPAVHQRYARFFASNFTAAETAELLRFYRSPTGTKVIQAKFDNINVSNLSDRFAADPNAKLSAGDIKTLNDSALPGALKGMAAEDIKALIGFGLQPIGRKLKGVAPQMAQIEAEIANAPDPELDAAIEAATRQIYQRFGLDEAAGDR
jgi:hypothetical protein